MQNFLGTLLLQKTSCELVFKGEFYKKWQTNILIIIKRYREVDSSFQKQTLRGKVHISEPLIESWHFNSFTDISFLNYVTEIFCDSYYLQEKNWECFKLQLLVPAFVFILLSKGANQLRGKIFTLLIKRIIDQ